MSRLTPSTAFTVFRPDLKWTFRSRIASSGSRAFIKNVLGEMAQRVMTRSQLNERRKLFAADLLHLVAARRKRTARRQMRRVRRQARDLVEGAFASRIGNRSQQ